MADSGAPAYLAHAPHAVMLAYGRPATHSLHLLLMRLWWQMQAPPHTLHTLLRRLCLHICDPPHSLHMLLTRLWWQMPAPPHTLHSLLRRLGSHIADPPHSLHGRNSLWSEEDRDRVVRKKTEIAIFRRRAMYTDAPPALYLVASFRQAASERVPAQ
jgi:hypothetical protein